MSNTLPVKYRDNGAIGALLDEYEKVINELIQIIKDVASNKLSTIIDHQTKDEDCRSIQTILTHVIQAGFAYATYIRNFQGENLTFHKKKHLNSSNKYIDEIKEMFRFTEIVFEDYPNITIEESDSNHKILTSWGQRYDVEQLMEHAIVHILRHRRQIERFIIKL